MNVQNVKQEKNRLSFDMVIDAEAYEAGLQKAYLKTRGRYNIPGFRKGKASRKMIEMYYGQDVFLSDAIDEIFAENYEKAIEENGWKIVSQPALTNVDVSETKELTLSLAADVYPEVTLGQYKGIEAPKVAAEVSDEEVEQELDRKAKEVARIETVDRPAKEGDTVVIDYEGSVNGVPFDGGKAEGYELTLGSHSFIPGFEEALIGVTANQELPINVTFPADYHADLAGKDAVFQIKVHEVKETQIPEKDDELAKDVSEFDTLEELRSDIRATILKQKSEGIERAYENAILEKLSQNIEVDIPAAMIDDEVKAQLNDFDMQLRSQGMSLEQYGKMIGGLSALETSTRPMAERTVRIRLALAKIAETENLEVSEDEINAEFENLAKQYGMDVEKIRAAVPQDEVVSDLRNRKARDLVVGSAVATEPAKAEEAENKE